MDGLSHWNEEEECFDIATPHALSQISGYAKYSLSDDGNVFFRGQTKHFCEMRPSLFRKVTSQGTADHRVKISRDYIKEIFSDGVFLTNTPRQSCEPLLQHYGLRTCWLDLVDNIWSALWFSCHEAQLAGTNGQYVTYTASCQSYSYIYLFQPGKEKRHEAAGIYTTQHAMKVIDLRIAAPSLYLRPHSQHGLLAMRCDLRAGKGMDYSDQVVLVLRIETTKAIDWIGNSLLMQDHFMFPSPKFDQGYMTFLDKKVSPPPVMGAFQYICV